MNDTAAIRTSGLGKRYGSRWALRDCTLEIPSGSVTALVGPNGAGKTTLLHMVIGPGIDPNLLSHIFEPGIRGTPAANSPDNGAGLGLTIAKRLLEHQHATLTIHDQPTGGAAVSLTLKRAASANQS